MPTQPYHNAEGKRLSGVTTVIGSNSGWNKDVLMGWANREGLAGRNIRQRGGTAERAADIGTVAHTMIEAHILGHDPEAVAAPLMLALAPSDQARARTGFASFIRWFKNQRTLVVATEIWGVSEKYQTGFCADALGIEQDEQTLSLYDWKSSKGTYADHVIQTASYVNFIEQALSEWLGKPIRLAGAHVVRVDKENGNFSHKFWTRDSLETAWNAFTWLRALHEVRWDIERLAR